MIAQLSRTKLRTIGAYVLVAAVAFALGALLFRASPEAAREAGATSHEGHDESSDATAIWTCAMHPQIRQSAPGNCPICGMELIPVQSDSEGDARPERITLSERAAALARLRTSEVRRMADPTTELRLLGRVEPDESAAKTVTAWVNGRIDRLHVRTTGERVRAGQTIATLYSPEVLAAHQDLLAAGRQLERMQGAGDSARAAAQAALDAARDRLRLLGVSDERVRAMEAEPRPTRQLAIQSPFQGTVIERLATEGAYVNTGDPLYRIADLSRVWVQLDAYEQDLPLLAVGQPVRIEVESLPEPFEGRVGFISPIVDPTRRTARVRVEVENRAGRLRPGMFAQAIVSAKPGSGGERPLVVPHSAPLFTGQRALVYVEVPESERPTYEARVVRLGPRAGEVYPVVAGLAEGERIVTRGAFVLDADLQIRGGASMMAGSGDEGEGPWDFAIELSVSERAKLAPIVSAYLEVQQALAANELQRAQRAADTLDERAAQVELERPARAKETWPALSALLRQHAQALSKVGSLEAARAAFEALSEPLTSLLQRFGNPLEQPLRIAFCPMAAGGGASWIQRESGIDNPYFGPAMRECGEVRQSVSPNAHLPRPAKPKPSASEPAKGHSH